MLIRSQGQKANIYIRIPFFYIPFGPKIFCTLTFIDIIFYPLACLRKENIDTIHIEKRMVGSDFESLKS